MLALSETILKPFDSKQQKKLSGLLFPDSGLSEHMGQGGYMQSLLSQYMDRTPRWMLWDGNCT